MGPCAVCQADAVQCCSKCKSAYYCSRQHQKDDWKRHKGQCLPYKVTETALLGRYLVASRRIAAGEVILRERPLIHGPKSKSAPLCLACYRSFEPTTDGSPCPHCRWPLCGQCTPETGLHRRAECQLMTDHAPPQPDQWDRLCQCLTPVRLLLLAGTDDSVGSVVDRLEAHTERRRHIAAYASMDAETAAAAHRLFAACSDVVEGERLRRAAGILDTNTFEVRTPGRVAVRALYATASLLNHQCRPNTGHFFDAQDMAIRVVATVDIEPGEAITATYTQSLWPTLNRRSHLNAVKHFWCQCQRCADAGELGTDLAGLRCATCADLVLSDDPLDPAAAWSCRRCRRPVSAAQAAVRHEQVRRRLKQLAAECRLRPELLERFIDECGRDLHPNSSYVFEARLALVQLYGNSKNLYYDELSDEQVAAKTDSCERLLWLADRLEPGWSHFRGQMLFEAQAVAQQRIARLQRRRLAPPQQLQAELKLVDGKLREAAEILRYDHRMSESLARSRADLDQLIIVASA